MSDVLLSVVVNVHREGDWAHRAIRSACAALLRLYKERDAKTELIVVADRADDRTIECCSFGRYVDEIGGRFEILKTDLGDLGLARNAGVNVARGRFVAFLDGDDIWSEDWPRLGVAALEHAIEHKGDALVVAHPGINVDFGDGAFWWSQPDQRDRFFDPSTFWTTNCWSSGAMCTREGLVREPYKPRTQGLGFEDWEWNARTIAAGYLHVSVPQAVAFIRKKRDGLNAQSAAKRQLVAHSPYFERDPDSIARHENVPYWRPDPEEGWLSRQWRAAHEFEPALWPDARRVAELPRYEARPVRSVPKVCSMIASKVDYVPTHVILAPCIVRSGADKRIVDYAKAIARNGGKPLVLLTDRPSDDEWARTQSSAREVHAINAHEVFRAAGDDASIFALVRLLMRWAPDVHLVNSRLGWLAVANFGRALRDSGCRIYASLYGSETTRGRRGGAAFNGWFDAAKAHISCIISDNNAHLEEIERVFKWDRDLAHVVPSIVEVPTIPTPALRRDATRVLWASRIVQGKRLDRLLATARLAHEHKLPFFFAIAGAPADHQARQLVADLKRLPNVKVSAKAFDGWSTLAPERHDVFMFTSESEGMPNVVLEALARGLPVCSTAVGDVPALPEDYVEIVRNPDDPREWLERLASAQKRRVQAMGAREYLSDNHSATAFDEALRGIGYFDYIDAEAP